MVTHLQFVDMGFPGTTCGLVLHGSMLLRRPYRQNSGPCRASELHPLPGTVLMSPGISADGPIKARPMSARPRSSLNRVQRFT